MLKDGQGHTRQLETIRKQGQQLFYQSQYNLSPQALKVKRGIFNAKSPIDNIDDNKPHQ